MASSGTLLKAITLLYLTSTTFAHSWIEQIALISPNGTFAGSFGYPRGYIARTDPGFTGGSMVNLLPSLASGRNRINGSDLLCMPSQSSTSSQTSAYPRMKVAPGSALALRRLENGHVSLPQNQPGKAPYGGTTYVFGTSSPSSTELITDVLSWNTDGTSGDSRGRLIAATNYDDGRCRQLNGGAISKQRAAEFPNPIPGQPGTNAEIWCETDVILPSDLQPGSVYTAYWVWDWKTEAGTPGVEAGKDEYYTTCMDFDVVSEDEIEAVMGDATSGGLVQQDPMKSAVSDWASRTAAISIPDVAFATQESWSGLAWGTATAQAAAASSTSTVFSGMPANTSATTTTLASSTPVAASSSPPLFTGMAVTTGVAPQRFVNSTSTTTSSASTLAVQTSTPYLTSVLLTTSALASLTDSSVLPTTSVLGADTPTPVVMEAVITITATVPAGESTSTLR